MGTIRNRKKHTHSHKKNGPPDVTQVIHRFEVWDRNTSKALSVCANAKSAMPGLRPLMKVIEISCNGVTWLVGTAVIFLLSLRPNDVELIVNAFFSEYDDWTTYLFLCAVLICLYQNDQQSHILQLKGCIIPSTWRFLPLPVHFPIHALL